MLGNPRTLMYLIWWLVLRCFGPASPRCPLVAVLIYALWLLVVTLSPAKLRALCFF